MKFIYKDISEFETEYINSESYSARCDCGGRRGFLLEDSQIIVDSYFIEIEECPVLYCRRCGKFKLGNLVPNEIMRTFYQLEQSSGYTSCKLTLRKKSFEYCADVNYLYDSRDLNMPRIGFDMDPTNKEGFSCPVFFDKKILNIFASDDDYYLNLFSESYGAIYKKGTGGWKWEWEIVFGINANNRVVMFLGDLAQIDTDDRAVLWLKSYNIESDHDFIDTEMYKGQFECEFSKPIIERQIIKLRNHFFKRVEDEIGVSLHHLEEEVEKSGNEIKKPINFSRQEIKNNIIILDGVLNEGIAVEEMRSLYKKIVPKIPKNIDELKSRKLLQGIIAKVSGVDFARKIMAPLFYLNDLRVCYAHLISQREIDEKMNNIIIAYGLSDATEYEKLYCILLEDLYKLYSYLVIMTMEKLEDE